MTGQEEHYGSRRFRIPPNPYPEGWHFYAVVLKLLWVLWAFAACFFGPVTLQEGATPRTIAFGSVTLVLVALTLVLLPRYLDHSPKREVTVDREGLTLAMDAKWWRPARSWRVEWGRAQIVHTCTVTFSERRGRYSHPLVDRPALDLYLYSGTVGVPRWVRAVDAEAGASLPVEPPSARVRITGRGPLGTFAVNGLVRAVRNQRPDVFHRPPMV
ncbi:hypothetical protein [Nocardiopsis oceani]